MCLVSCFPFRPQLRFPPTQRRPNEGSDPSWPGDKHGHNSGKSWTPDQSKCSISARRASSMDYSRWPTSNSQSWLLTSALSQQNGSQLAPCLFRLGQDLRKRISATTYDHVQSIAAMDQLDSIYGLEGAFRTATANTPGSTSSNCASVALRSSAALLLGPIFSLPRASMQSVPHSSPKVDVMVLYTKHAWEDNFHQEGTLENKIVGAFVLTNKAMFNSEIALEINLEYVARVSAGVEEARPCGTWWWWSFCVTKAMCRCFRAFVSVVDVDGRSCAKIAEKYAPLAVGAPGL